MRLKIRELCEKRGIKSAYELSIKANRLNMTTAYRAFNNDVKQFTLATLEALCSALKCTPSDIFGVEVAAKLPEPKILIPSNLVMVEGEKYLSTKEVAERLGRKPRTIIDLFKSGKLERIKRGQENFVAESVLKAFEEKWKN
jgi:DNA-binding Xre family transcriptional regulator